MSRKLSRTEDGQSESSNATLRSKVTFPVRQVSATSLTSTPSKCLDPLERCRRKVRDDKKGKQGSSDCSNLIKNSIEKVKDEGFVYLTYKEKMSSVHFSPYNLKEEEYDLVNKKEFYTLSSRGVTLWSNSGNTYTEIKEWEKEFNLFCKIQKIRTFAQFRLWKSFTVWRNIIKWIKYCNARNFVQQHLFLAIPDLACYLLKLKEDLYHLESFNFFNMSDIEDWQVFYFIERQMRSIEQLQKALRDFRVKAKEYLYDACYKALIKKGFYAVDEATVYASAKKMREAMSFMDKAKKRKFCKLLSDYLTYCDYITVTFLQNLCAKSYADLANAFIKHHQCAPSEEKLRNTHYNDPIEPPRTAIQPKLPFFNATLILRTTEIEVDPPMQVVINIFEQVLGIINDTVHEIKRFTTDPFYLQFTEPSIMGRQEDRLARNPPDLAFIFNTDMQYQNNKKSIFEIIRQSFKNVTIYLTKFESIRINYAIDVKTDSDVVQSERDLEKLREYCRRCRDNISAIEDIPPNVSLGLINLKQTTFKEEIEPICKNLLADLLVYIPNLAISEVQRTNEKAQDLVARITAEPTTTLEFINYLRFLNSSGVEVAALLEQVDYAHDVFIILKDFSIPIDDEEKENYIDCEDMANQCKVILQNKLDEKDRFIALLDEIMQQDIQGIFEEVNEVLVEIQDPKYLDINSKKSEIRSMLNTLTSRLMQCQEKAHEYIGYQQEFHIPVTEYDEIDKTFQQINYRKVVWNSVEEWENALLDWYKTPFHTLDVKELNDLTTKIYDTCIDFEEHLPPNEPITELKASAGKFMKKLPVIGYLRNPELKARHWLKIEKLIQRKVYQEEELKIGDFDDIHVFEDDYAHQLSKISGDATGEAQQEVKLKSVEQVWKDTELVIEPYKQAKDVFILGGIEKLEAIVDESNITINNIMASPFMGPIKHKVEEWLRLLDIFSETLEEWSTCQTSWITLEAIFASPDVQKQLPQEVTMFGIVDQNFNEAMRRAFKISLALPILTDPLNLDVMKINNQLLESIRKALEAYLEVKRLVFPRFFFVSNKEMLDILGQSKNPEAIQPHVKKFFDGISRLELGYKETEKGEKIMTNDIVAMLSPEGERVLFGKGLKARGPSEDWLSKVETAMFLAVRRYMKFGYQCYGAKQKSLWCQEHPIQVVLTVSQQQWAADVHDIFENRQSDATAALEQYLEKWKSNLATSIAMVKTQITNVFRKLIIQLITVDLHARFVMEALIKKRISQSTDFNWTRNFRIYWSTDSETMNAKMSYISINYFYEYLGSGVDLVITPLTDRCFLSLLCAFQMHLGGCIGGPTGSGKTETVKNLSKAVAKRCFLFNCAKFIGFKTIAQFLSGMSQSGAWCFFDEFDRLNTDVLSVVAQQLRTIYHAKSAGRKRLMFEGRETKLDISCAIFTTTFYYQVQRRTLIPDNLKTLFRTYYAVSVDAQILTETTLLFEGFEEYKTLGNKIIRFYKFCERQLSKQSQYDFSIRALKHTLKMAGQLLRMKKFESEQMIVATALRTTNMSRLLKEDAETFKSLLRDIFGTETYSSTVHDIVKGAIREYLLGKNLLPTPFTIINTINLYEAVTTRSGVIVLGSAGTGKTTAIYTLAGALELLFNKHVEGSNFRKVKLSVYHTNSIDMERYFGRFEKSGSSWKDGLVPLELRKECEDNTHQWIVFDGAIDHEWTECFNSFLDESKILCLNNAERFLLTSWHHIIFQTISLSSVSPSTMSRCALVYLRGTDLNSFEVIKSWLKDFSKSVTPDIIATLNNFYEKYLEKILEIDETYGVRDIILITTAKLQSCYDLLTILIMETLENAHFSVEPDIKEQQLGKIFLWTTMWGICSSCEETSRGIIEQEVRKIMEANEIIEFPEGGIWDYKLNIESNLWEHWNKFIEPFKFDPTIDYCDLKVCTLNMIKHSFIFETLARNKKSVLITGNLGVGKTTLASMALKNIVKYKVAPVLVNFTCTTTSARARSILEAQGESRRKNQLSAPVGKIVVVIIEDFNAPFKDKSGSRPAVQFIRQILEFKGYYERDRLFWKNVIDIVVCGTCNIGGRYRDLPNARFFRHFTVLHLSEPTDDLLRSIFGKLLEGFFIDSPAVVEPVLDKVINTNIDLYRRISKSLLPVPNKPHYIFNMHDFSKCIQGFLQCRYLNFSREKDITRLLRHEGHRVYKDRLVHNEDILVYNNILQSVIKEHFNEDIVPDELILFGDFMNNERIYEEIPDVDKLRIHLVDAIEEHRKLTGVITNIVLFDDAMRTIIAVCRWLRMHRGNGILIGLPGMGRDWITRLSAHLNDYLLFEIKLHRVLDRAAFLKKLQKLARVSVLLSNKPIVFLLQNMLISEDGFLEDMINLADSVDFSELLTTELIAEAKTHFFKDTEVEMDLRAEKDMFLKKLRDNLHVVVTLNNTEKLRKTFRDFQPLLRAYSIRWLYNWTKDGLRDAAIVMLSDEEEDYKFKLADMAAYIHTTVEKTSEEYFIKVKQRTFRTPRLYVQFLDSYRKLVVDLRQKLLKRIDRITRGLKKLSDASKTVVVMQGELQVLEPQLEQQAYVMQELITKLEADMAAVEKVKDMVAADEAIAKEKQIICQAAADDVAKDLEITMPAIREAEELINAIGKNEINELKNVATPPTPVVAVFEAVCLLLGVKPAWATVKTLLSEPDFLLRILSFDREHISEATLKKLKKYLDNKEFVPAKVEKQSKIAKIFCMWVIALDKFTKVYKVIETKVMKKEAADGEYREVLRVLRGKQQDLAEVEAKIQLLKDEIEEKNLEFKRLRDDVDIGNFRIVRGSKLAAALTDEETRWKDLAEITQSQIESVRGDSMITSACISYLGAYTGSFRKSLLDSWFSEGRANDVAIDKNFDLIEILEERQNVLNWTANGLAKDKFSVDNGIYVSRAHDWPLILDPQQKASKWIKALEKDNNLHVIKMNEKRILKVFETCATNGYPLIVEKIGDTLDPIVYAFFKNLLYSIGGNLVSKIKGMTIKIHENFKLYLITTLLSPRYRYEDYNNVTLINFNLTHRGLEDILWGYIVEKETPDLEKQRVAFEMKMVTDKLQLIEMEKRILDILLLAPENMLDDETLVETLCDGKETLLILSTRYEESVEGIANVVAAQERFRPLATYAVCVYFVTVSLSDINPMYQFTINYLREQFLSVFSKKRIQMPPDEKFEILTNELKQTLHFSLTRGLYDKHIIVVNYLLATSLEKQAGRITEGELEIFRTAFNYNEESEFRSSVLKPDDVTLSDNVWYSCKFLEYTFPQVFTNISDEVRHKITINIHDFKVDIDITNQNEASLTDWDTKLTDFQKLLLIKFLKLEKLITSVNAFARKIIGDFCTSVHEKKLSLLYKEMDNTNPLLLLLTSGFDPTNELIKFVEQKKFTEKFTFVSLGIDQEALAEATLEKGIKLGTWVYLQNCHLATNWLSKLAEILNNIILMNVKTHPDFRLFLSSLPTPSFPRSVLEQSIKISLEPPKGVRASLLRILNDLDQNFFESHVLGKKWRMIVFGLCMCHAVILQRHKYGSVGWSNIYDFNDNDLNAGLRVLDKFIPRGNVAPINWAGFSKMNRKITYGGITTNFWDYRCLTTTFQKYCSPLIFEKNYSYDKNGIYRNPQYPTKAQVMDYVKGWPKEDDPTIFGLHENADINLKREQTEQLIHELQLESIPRDFVTPTNYEYCLEIIEKIIESTEIFVPEKVPDDKNLPINSPSMRPLKTALTLELDRLNSRYKLLRHHITELSDAIKGYRVMSDELEHVCLALVNNQLPPQWSSRCTFANNLPNWIKNFQFRIYFFKEWLEKGNPISWWLGGFFYPQCFLAGYLQTYAIREHVSIENLSFDYEVQTQILYQQNIMEKYRNGEDTKDAYGGLVRTESGVYIHGLFIEYGSWDTTTGMLCDAIPHELCSRFPVMLLKPCVDLKIKKRCEIPLYQTESRSKDSVSEEIHNLVLAVLLKARYEYQYWNLRGTALFSTHSSDTS